MSRSRLLALLVSGAFAAVPGAAGQAPVVDPEVRAKLAALPAATHHSEVRVDFEAARNETRIWINTNEDDGRLYSPAGGQMDADFKVWSVIRGRAGAGVLPAEVGIDFATLGEMRPATGPQVLELVADGRAVRLSQVAEPDARSGQLIFLSLKATMPLSEFVRLTTSRRVEGRIWGHPFALIEAQLEILRAYGLRLLDA